jgi:prevent-host-death family protein
MSDMRSITATEFRAKCLALLDEIAETRETLVVTKRGKPLVRVVPAAPIDDLSNPLPLEVGKDPPSAILTRLRRDER